MAMPPHGELICALHPYQHLSAFPSFWVQKADHTPWFSSIKCPQIYEKEGIAGLYKGSAPSILKVHRLLLSASMQQLLALHVKPRPREAAVWAFPDPASAAFGACGRSDAPARRQSAPQAAVTFAVYEFVMRQLNERWTSDQ